MMQRYRAIPAFTLWGMCSPIVLVPIAVFSVLSLASPIDVLDSWQWMRAYTGFLSRKIPWLGGHAQSTAYPQVALAMACMAITLLFWIIVFTVLYCIKNHPQLVQNQRAFRTVTWGKVFLMALLAPPGVYGLMFGAFAIPGDPSWAAGFTTSSRVGFILLCISLVYPAGMVIGAIPGSFRLLIELDFKGESKDED